MSRNLKPSIFTVKVLSGFTSLVGFLLRVKTAKEKTPSIYLDSGFPLTAGLVPTYAFHPSTTIATRQNVHLICGIVRRSQVLNSVVAFFKIDMVNLLGQIAMMPKPNQSVFKSCNFTHSEPDDNLSVSRLTVINLKRSSDFTSLVASGAGFPNQTPRSGVVVKKLFQKLLRNVSAGKICLAHAFAPISDSLGSGLAVLAHR